MNTMCVRCSFQRAFSTLLVAQLQQPLCYISGIATSSRLSSHCRCESSGCAAGLVPSCNVRSNCVHRTAKGTIPTSTLGLHIWHSPSSADDLTAIQRYLLKPSQQGQSGSSIVLRKYRKIHIVRMQLVDWSQSVKCDPQWARGSFLSTAGKNLTVSQLNRRCQAF